MTEPDRTNYVASYGWDGSAPHKKASKAPFPITDDEWFALKAIFPLPEEVRSEIDVFVSVLRGVMDFKSYDHPPSATGLQFARFAEKVEKLNREFSSLMFNETAAKYIDGDPELWDSVVPALQRASERMREYSEEARSEIAKPGQKWEHYQHFTDILENILNRYGLSLVDGSGRLEPSQKSIDFLRKLLRLGNASEIKETTAESKIREIAKRKRLYSQASQDS